MSLLRKQQKNKNYFNLKNCNNSTVKVSCELSKHRTSCSSTNPKGHSNGLIAPDSRIIPGTFTPHSTKKSSRLPIPIFTTHFAHLRLCCDCCFTGALSRFSVTSPMNLRKYFASSASFINHDRSLFVAVFHRVSRMLKKPKERRFSAVKWRYSRKY